MTYEANIPASTDLISNSQSQIQANFNALNTIFGGTSPTTGGDHDGYNTGSGNGSGMHNQVTFTANQSAPSLTRNSVLGVGGLYVNTVSAVSQLFYQNATQNVQLTNLTRTTSGSNYGVTTPWGLVFNWGVFVPGSSGTTVTFAVPFPNALQSVVCTAQSTSTANSANIVTVSAESTTSFKGYSSGSPNTNYFAVGY